MTVREALGNGASVLSGSGSLSPFLDASLLLSRAAGLSREALLSRAAELLSEDVRVEFQRLLGRRASGESVAYILGGKEFFGRTFFVDARVLVPRPETETLVEAVLESAARMTKKIGAVEPGAALRIHDAFTGSGCVGITLAAEIPCAEVSLSDLSPEALAVADANSRALLGRSLPMTRSDSLSGVSGPFDLVTANPPYVSSSETDRIESMAEPNAREPRSALDGGPDGIALYRRLVPEAEKRLAQGGILAVEIGDDQGPRIAELFRASGFVGVEILADLAGRDRVVRGSRA